MGVPLPPCVGDEDEEGDGGGGGGAANDNNDNHPHNPHQPAPPSLFAPDLSLGSMLRATGPDATGPTTFAGLIAGLPKPGGNGGGGNAPRLSFEARLQAAANAPTTAAQTLPPSAVPVPHAHAPTAAAGISEVPPPPPMSLLGALPGGTRGVGGISLPPVAGGGGEAAAAANDDAGGAPAAAAAAGGNNGGGGVGPLGTATVQAFESLADGLGSLLAAPGDSWMAGPPPQARDADGGGGGGGTAAAAGAAAAPPLGPRPFGALFPSPPAPVPGEHQ